MDQKMGCIPTVSSSSEWKEADRRVYKGMNPRFYWRAIRVGTTFDVENVIVIFGGH
jgi:hypothetical protein